MGRKLTLCVFVCVRQRIVWRQRTPQVSYLRTSCRIFISCCCNSVITSTPSVRHSGRAPTYTCILLVHISSAYLLVWTCFGMYAHVLIKPTIPFFNDPEGLKLQLHVLLDHQWTKHLEVIRSQNWLEHRLKYKNDKNMQPNMRPWKNHSIHEIIIGA